MYINCSFLYHITIRSLNISISYNHNCRHTFPLQNASVATDASLEPQPLWEYPSTARTDVFTLMAFDFSKPLHGIKTIERTGMLEINRSGPRSESQNIIYGHYLSIALKKLFLFFMVIFTFDWIHVKATFNQML